MPLDETRGKAPEYPPGSQPGTAPSQAPEIVSWYKVYGSSPAFMIGVDAEGNSWKVSPRGECEGPFASRSVLLRMNRLDEEDLYLSTEGNPTDLTLTPQATGQATNEPAAKTAIAAFLLAATPSLLGANLALNSLGRDSTRGLVTSAALVAIGPSLGLGYAGYARYAVVAAALRGGLLIMIPGLSLSRAGDFNGERLALVSIACGVAFAAFDIVAAPVRLRSASKPKPSLSLLGRW